MEIQQNVYMKLLACKVPVKVFIAIFTGFTGFTGIFYNKYIVGCIWYVLQVLYKKNGVKPV